MDIILSHILLRIATMSQPLLPEISEHTSNYLQNVDSAGILAHDLNPWLTENFNFTLVLWNDWTKHQDQIVQAYIVDLRGFKEISHNDMQALRRTAVTKFVFLSDCKNCTKFPDELRKFGFCQVLSIVIKGQDVAVYEPKGECVGRGLELVSEENGEACYMHASFMDLQPHNILINDKLSGWEGLHLQTTADLWNMTVNWTNHHEIGWVELVDDAAEGRSLAVLGGMYTFHYRWMLTDVIYSCMPVTMKWAAPQHSGQNKPTWFIILMSELSPTVWASSFGLFLALIILGQFLTDHNQQHDPMYRPFHIIALILGSSQNFIFRRIFTMTIIYFGFMITLYYQAIMSSKLTAPEKLAEINTWEEMLASGLAIKGNAPMKKMVQAVADNDPGNKIKQEVYNKYIVEQKPLKDMLLNVVLNRDMMYARHTSNIIYVAQQDPRIAGKIHIVDEPANAYLPITMMPKHSCLADKMQTSYYRICASGLAAKWYADFTTIKPEVASKAPKKLAIGHIKGFLYLLLLGWILASVTFFIEVVTSRIISGRSDKKLGKGRLFKTVWNVEKQVNTSGQLIRH